ncbi:MAG TPA: hypothetical protein VGA78_02575, partial [Gemmatimonadales bacterium]
LRHQVRVLDACPAVEAVFHDYIWFKSGSDPEQGGRYLLRERFLERAAVYLIPAPETGCPAFLASRDIIKFMSTEIVGMHTSALAIRAQALSRITPQPPFREELPHGEDIDLWLRIASQTSLAIINLPLSYYRHRDNSWMNSHSRRRLALGSYLVKSEMLDRLERMLTPAEWPVFRDRIASYWQGLAYQSLVAGLYPEARRGFRESLRISRNTRVSLLALKGLGVSLLPRVVLRSYWRATGGGEFARRGTPPAT